MKASPLLALAAVLSGVRGLVIIDSILATDCIYTMKDYDWGCSSTGQGATAYSCRCHNVDWVGSVTSCFETKGVNNSREYIDHAYRHLRGRCISKGRIDWPVEVLKWYQENATNYIMDPETSDLSSTLYHPIGVNETSFAYYSKSFNHIYAQVIRSQAYQWGYVFFWTFVILCGTLFNLFNHFIVNYTGTSKSKFTSPLLQKFRSTVTLPNTFNKSHYRLFSFIPLHVPRTFESVILFFFSVYTVLACTTGFTIELPNAYMNGQFWQLMDLVGYRTALCSFGLIPPTFFFGIRNNPFIKLTGSTIQTFMTYHKWTAWAMSINALIHSAVWTAYTIKEGDYSAWAVDAYWQWGIAGTTVCFFMLFFASAFWRELAYEFFLLIHQLFGVFLIVTMWFHCNTLGWMGWLYASIAIWFYDRLVRFLSLLFNGGVKTAKVTKLNDGLIRVVVEKPKDSAYFPGAYYFYYFLNAKLRFFQSHPFSVMKSKRAGESGCYAIVIKTHKGITKKLMQQLEYKKAMLVDVLAEGPYGAPIPLKSHDQYVFICAGVGFTPCYSQAMDLVEKNTLRSTQTLIKFIWVVQTVEYYHLFKEDMDYLSANGVQVEVIVTRDSGKEVFTTSSGEDVITSEEEDNCCGSEKKQESSALMTMEGHTSVHLLGQRPNASELVTKTELPGSTVFITSGPIAFVDEIRASVAGVVKTADVRVDLYDESFDM